MLERIAMTYVRERAYQIWEEEGRPEGKAEEHWLRAEAEAGTEAALDEALDASFPASDPPAMTGSFVVGRSRHARRAHR